MFLRRLTNDDIEAVYPIMYENHQLGGLSDGDSYSHEQYAAIMCRSIPNMYALGVFIEDELACIFWHIPMSNSIYCRHSNMNVKFRGKGLYTSMVKEATDHVLKMGKHILSMVPVSNVKVIKSLKNNNFTHVGNLPECFSVGGNRVDIEMYWRA